jgi:Zn-dependent M28 family amino/carboxypeptidase
VIRIYNEDATAAVVEGRPLTITLHLAPPTRTDAPTRNVIGLLRGSDPALSSQYVLVSAHYDHLGIKGGRIYNGANDDGSGVVSVIEIANALASLATRPKRSIVFAAFFGEEEGLLGSQYYARHPPVPLSATVANINLEQMGRTDEQDGREVGSFAFTGPSYSTLPATMTAAARAQGVKVYSKRGADSYFNRSDNYSLAKAGVVAHTLVVAFEYPDYHGPGDKWEKVDYANMAKVDRAIAAGIVEIAGDPAPPKWTGRHP